MQYAIPDLRRFVAEGEGPALEFKQGVGEEIGRTISAFANTYGGIIVIGVSTKGELAGVEEADKTSQKLRNIIERCKSAPKMEQQFISESGKTFIMLKVEPTDPLHAPCSFDGRFYIRLGSTNKQLDAEELIELLKNRSLLSFESGRCNATIDDLDPIKIEAVLNRRDSKVNVKDKAQLRGALVGLNVAGGNGEFFLKNVALMFFAKDPTRFMPNLKVRVVKYAGEEPALTAIKSDERFQDTLPELIEKAYKSSVSLAGSRFVLEGLKRKEVPIYPVEALREAITNAVGHRDYFNQNAALIEIFDDRMQITSPGGLLQGQTIKNFYRYPQHRNPITYELLQDLGYGEGLGLGIRLMTQQFIDAGLSLPEFYNIGTAFRVVMYNDLSKKTRRTLTQLNQRQVRALEYIKEHGTVKLAEYAKIEGISIVTALHDINSLIALGNVVRVGKSRGAYYKLA